MSLILSILLTVSPYLARVYEYMPAPGQFVNAMPVATADDTPQTMAAKAEASIANNAGKTVCLGAWGGYIVFGFDHPVVNSGDEYDFRIKGNASYASYAKDTNRKGGSSEPGIVMVSYDANGNGLPDDTWYELAGSEYNSPQTIRHYAVTYTRPNGLEDVPWTDNRGGSGVVPRNAFHQQDYYPLWAPDELTFTGSRLAPNAVDEGENGEHSFILYCYDYGYADNHPNKTDGCKFCIRWAVDQNGVPKDLQAIHFVKVYTAVQQVCGWIGETSTEITGAEDLHPDMPLPDTQTDIPLTDIPWSAQNPERPTKILINGQIHILRGEKVYNAQGALVK